jgi:hypothetical protein
MQKVTHRDLQRFDHLLRRLGETKEGPWFLYTVSRNRSAIEPFIKALGEAQAPTELEKEYQKARTALLEAHTTKDAKGNSVRLPITLPDGQQGLKYDIKDEAAFFAAETEMVKEKFPTLEDAARAKLELIQALLDSEAEVVLTPFKMSDVPKNLLSGNDVHLMLQIGVLDFDLKRDEETKEE